MFTWGSCLLNWSVLLTVSSRINTELRSQQKPTLGYPRKRWHCCWKLNQELNWKISFHGQYTHAKIISRKRETYQNRAKNCVLFVFELDDEYKIIKPIHQQLKKYVLGCKWLGWMDRKFGFSLLKMAAVRHFRFMGHILGHPQIPAWDLSFCKTWLESLQ